MSDFAVLDDSKTSQVEIPSGWQAFDRLKGIARRAGRLPYSLRAAYAGGALLVRYLRQSLRLYLGRDGFAATLAKLFFDDNNGESLFVSILGHLGIAALLRHRCLRPLGKHWIELVFAYLSLPYLARSFNRKARREILACHYAHLADRVKDSFFEDLMKERVVLWQKVVRDGVCAISLQCNVGNHREGALSLIFEKDFTPIYDLSWTIVPGHVVGDPAGHVLLVARLQGRNGQLANIRRAAKACGDIVPPYLLMTAAQAIANALDLKKIGAVSDREQLSRKRDSEGAPFDFSYDAFWGTLLADQPNGDEIQRRAMAQKPLFFDFPVPFPEKPLHQVTVMRRHRTRVRRKLKRQIEETVGNAFVEKLLKA